MQKGEPLESIVAVNIMTAKVKTDELKEVDELISQYRKENAEILKLVDDEYHILIKSDLPDELTSKRYWLLNIIIKSGKTRLVPTKYKIIGKHSLKNTSVKFFKEYANELNKKIIKMLEKDFVVENLSYAKIGKLCLILEIVNPDFDYYEKNMGIKLQSPKVKKVLRLFKKNYFKMVDEKISSEEFIQMLIKKEKKEKKEKKGK